MLAPDRGNYEKGKVSTDHRYFYEEDYPEVGAGESFVPIWGSGKQAFYDFQDGHIGMGLFNTGMAVSDVFLLKSIGTGVARGSWKVGGNSWGATRSWLNKTGWAKPGQSVHHWLIPQNGWGKIVPNGIKNQPWNLKVFSSHSAHMRLAHGQTYLGQPGANFLGQLWYGTPTWPKLTLIFGAGRTINNMR